MIKHRLEGFSAAWTLVLYLFAFNIFDTIGKKFAGNIKKYGPKITWFCFFFRFVNLAAYYYLAVGTTKFKWF